MTCPTCGRYEYAPYRDLSNDYACVDVCHYASMVRPSSYAERFSKFHGRKGTRLASYVTRILLVRERAREQLVRLVAAEGPSAIDPREN